VVTLGSFLTTPVYSASAMARVAERQLATKIELGWRVIRHSEDTT